MLSEDRPIEHIYNKMLDSTQKAPKETVKKQLYLNWLNKNSVKDEDALNNVKGETHWKINY